MKLDVLGQNRARCFTCNFERDIGPQILRLHRENVPRCPFRLDTFNRHDAFGENFWRMQDNSERLGLFQLEEVKHAELTDESKRLETFITLPYPQNTYMIPDKLARAGYFYEGKLMLTRQFFNCFSFLT